MDGDLRFDMIRAQIRELHAEADRERVVRQARAASPTRTIDRTPADRRPALGVLSFAGAFARRVGRRPLAA